MGRLTFLGMLLLGLSGCTVHLLPIHVHLPDKPSVTLRTSVVDPPESTEESPSEISVDSILNDFISGMEDLK